MATAATIDVALNLMMDEYHKGLDQANKEMSGFKKKTQKIGGQLSKIGTVMTAGVTLPVVAGFTKMTLGAAEASETVGAIDMVFGDASDTIHDFGEISATAAGLSKTEFKQLGTVTGSFLQNLGYSAEEAGDKTITLTERASDMAAVFNTDVSTALEAIQSGLKGEMNPLENFGVKLNAASIEAKAMAMGLQDAEGELDDNAKAQATLALIMEQTNRVQGTFAREAEGLSGQMKILKANVKDAGEGLGAVLLPAATEAITKITGLAQKFAGLDEDAQKTIVTIGLVVAGIGPLLLIVGKVIIALPKLKAGLAAAKAGMAAMKAASVGMLGPLGLVAAAIAAVVAAIVIFKQKTNEQIEVMKEVKAEALETGASYEEYKKGLQDAGHETDQTKQKTTEYRATLKTARADLERLRDEHVISKSKYEELYSKMDVGIITAEEMHEKVYNLEQDFKNMGSETQNAGSDLGYYMGQVQGATTETEAMDGAVGNAAQTAADYYDYVDLATAGTSDFTGEVGNLVNETVGADLAMQSYNESLLFAMASQGLTADEAFYLAEQMGLVDEKTVYAASSLENIRQRYDDGLIDAEQYRQAVANLGAEIEGLPSEKLIDIDVRSDTSKLDEVISKLGAIPSQVTSNVTVNVTEMGNVPTTVKEYGRAAGGPVWEGRPYLVGEEGPEWFVPNISGDIIPNGRGLPESSKQAAGNTVNYYLTARYPKESPMTLSQRMKVLEALHAN